MGLTDELKKAMVAVATEATRVDGILYQWTDVELTTAYREEIQGSPYPVYGARIAQHSVSGVTGGHVYGVRALHGVLGSKSCPPRARCSLCH